MMFNQMFVASTDDEILVRLDDTLRALLRQVSEELREVLLVDDPEHTQRLYPTAYPEDEKLEADYREMVHDQLLMQRLDAIDQMQSTIDDAAISIEMADCWMSTINQARLVLGTQLDVSEDDGTIDEDDPDATSKVIYQVLSHVLDELTQARLSSL